MATRPKPVTSDEKFGKWSTVHDADKRNVNKMEQAHIGTGERIVTRSGWGNREGVLNARTP